MGKCVKDEIWSSTRKGQPDGKFSIKEIDGAGHFTGTHEGDHISGDCNGSTISYTRYGASKSWYSGEFQTENDIKGVATPLPLATKRAFLPVDDDWVATHT
jgi:hypothetical protein